MNFIINAIFIIFFAFSFTCCEQKTIKEKIEKNKIKTTRKTKRTGKRAQSFHAIGKDKKLLIPQKHFNDSPFEIYTNEKKICTTKIKDWRPLIPGTNSQGACGSCYVFAPTAYFEALYYLKNKRRLLSNFDPTALVMLIAARNLKIPWKTHADLLDVFKSDQKFEHLGDKFTFKNATCSVGAEFEDVVWAIQQIYKEHGKDHMLCLDKFSSPIGLPLYRTYYVYSEDVPGDTAYVGWPVNALTDKTGTDSFEITPMSYQEERTIYNLNYTYQKNLNICPYIKGDDVDFSSDIPKDPHNSDLTRILPYPFFESYLSCLEKPYIVMMDANDYASMQTYEFNKLTPKMNFSMVDFGSHPVCIYDDKKGKGKCKKGYSHGDTDHILLTTSFEKKDDSKRYLTVRNSWGPTFGDNGYLPGKYVKPTVCKTSNDCQKDFKDILAKRNWDKLGWTLDCLAPYENAKSKFCMPAMKKDVKPVKCINEDNIPLPVILARCPTMEMHNAGGRCTNYYYYMDKDSKKAKFLGDDQYCVPSMPEAGIPSFCSGCMN